MMGNDFKILTPNEVPLKNPVEYAGNFLVRTAIVVCSIPLNGWVLEVGVGKWYHFNE